MGRKQCSFVMKYTTDKREIYNACLKHAKSQGCTVFKGAVCFSDQPAYTGVNQALLGSKKLIKNNCACLVSVFHDVPQGAEFNESPEYIEAYNRYTAYKRDFMADYDKVYYAPQNTSLKTITCKNCGAKFSTAVINSNSCMSCGQDLRPKTEKERLQQRYYQMEKLNKITSAEFEKCKTYAKPTPNTNENKKLFVRINYVENMQTA